MPPDTNPEDMAALAVCEVSLPYADSVVLVVNTVISKWQGQPGLSKDSAGGSRSKD